MARIKRLPVALLLGVASTASAAPVSFDEAVTRALAASPRLQAAEAGLLGTRASERQAARRPNPSIGVEVENFGGNRHFGGFDRAEITAEIEQPIELGGKRRARVAAARADTLLAGADAAAARRRLLADVIAAYAGAAAARERLAVLTGQARVAGTVAAQSTRRLAAGNIPEVQNDRAQVDLGEVQAALERARLDLATAERSLAALLTASEAVEAQPAWLAQLGPDPAGLQLEVSPDDLPEAARWSALSARARAGVDAARAARVPDVAVSAGVRALRDEDATALVVGLSLPLPVFDSGRNAAERARHELARAGYEVEAARAEATRDLSRALDEWRSAYASLDLLKERTLPSAERLLALTQRGYDAGALPYRDLADALDAVLEARLARIAALERLQTARAEVAALTGLFAAVGWPALENVTTDPLPADAR